MRPGTTARPRKPPIALPVGSVRQPRLASYRRQLGPAREDLGQAVKRPLRRPLAQPRFAADRAQSTYSYNRAEPV